LNGDFYGYLKTIIVEAVSDKAPSKLWPTKKISKIMVPANPWPSVCVFLADGS
jgi:hypothetical protein